MKVKNNNAVVYAFSDDYVDYALVSIYSLRKFNKSLEIFIFYTKFSKDNIEKLSDVNLKVKLIDISEYLLNLEIYGFEHYRGSLMTYAKLFIPIIFDPFIYEKVLYLDSDTLINKSIEQIFTFDLKDNYIGMCLDTMQGWHKLGIGLDEDDFYFNAGVVLFNLHFFRNLGFDYFDQAKEVFKKYKIRAADQDILNIVFRLKISIMPIIFNVLTPELIFSNSQLCKVYRINKNKYYREESVKNILEEGIIFHLVSSGFIGNPWTKGNLHPLRSLWINNYNELANKKFKYQASKLTSRMFFIRLLFQLLPRELFIYVLSKKYREIERKEIGYQRF